jgi:hypothetical protein
VETLLVYTTLTLSKCIAGQCIIVPQVYYGAGRHIEYIEIHNFQNSFKLNFVTQPLYLFAICLTKISVGFFLLRIAVQSFYRRMIIGIMCKSVYLHAAIDGV